MQRCRQILLGGLLGVMLMASGCDMSTPSQVGINKIRVRDGMFTDALSADHVDMQRVAFEAHNIQRSGSAEATLLVPYKDGGESKAWDIGAAYKKAFAAQGIPNLSVNVVAMEKGQSAKEAVLSYEGLAALAPEGCGRIPGYHGTVDIGEADEYKYGCETQEALSKMVANPADLLGTAQPPEANSQRNGKLIDPYMQGTPNQPLKGMTASTIGTQ